MNLSKELVEKGNNKFLVSSKEPYLIKDFVEKVRSVFSTHSYKKCNSIDDFIESYHRGDVFSDSPMILCLWDLKADDIKDLSLITTYTTKDILIFIERKPLAKNKAYTNFKSDCYSVDLETLNEKECLKWVSNKMLESSLRFDREIPKILVEKKSKDLYAIESEIRKLKVVYGEKEIDITAGKYIAESSEARIFEFLEHFFHKRKDKAFQEFNKFPEEHYTKLISTILGNIEKIYKIAVYKGQNKTPEDISEIIGINKFIIKTKYFTVLSVFSKIKLLKLIDLFNDLDYNLRLSPLSKKTLFEAYILKAFNV
jgi:DNA polymerase III delta subunit